MSEEYRTKMILAEKHEQVIARFREGDDSTKPIRLNFASKTQRDWQEAVRSYQEAFDIYRDFNQPEKAKSLLNNLFDLVQTCDEFTSSLAIQLLSTLENSYKWMEQVAPGTQDQLKTALSFAIGQKLLQKEMEFWLLLRALNFLRDLASDDPERRTVDISLCQVMDLGAQVSFRRGNLDNAEGWYRDAARIAQDRVGDIEWANHLLQAAGNIQQIRTRRLPGSAFAQVMQSEAPSTPESVEAMQQLNIVESLEIILHKAAEEQHGERFLPLVEELVADYKSKEDKLFTLLADERLLLNKSKIEEREARYRGKGLSGWIPGRFVDSQGNPRGGFDANARFTVQYVAEIAEAIGVLFNTWQEQGYLTESHIAHLFSHLGSYYDWRICKAGLSRHFQSDFVCAIHTLMPQFENVVRTSAQIAGVDIKKFKGSVPGDVLLNDLINPNNTKMRELLGEGLFDLVYWYLVNSGSPFGYRHKIAHGWIRSEDCNLQLSAMTIWLTLRVIDTIAQIRAS
ncbi:MAG: hypothetical protein Fur0021_02490 [Candidatus Promineifilaceae bacterium]